MLRKIRLTTAIGNAKNIQLILIVESILTSMLYPSSIGAIS